MKTTDKFELTGNWWKTHKGKTVSDGGLESALNTYVAAKLRSDNNPSYEHFDKAMKALYEVRGTIKEVAQKCKTLLNQGETKTVLEAAATKKTIEDAEGEIKTARDGYDTKLKEATAFLKNLKPKGANALAVQISGVREQIGQFKEALTAKKDEKIANLRADQLVASFGKFWDLYSQFKEDYGTFQKKHYNFVMKTAANEDSAEAREMMEPFHEVQLTVEKDAKLFKGFEGNMDKLLAAAFPKAKEETEDQPAQKTEGV